MKNKFLIGLIGLCLVGTAHASMRFINSGGTDLGSLSKMTCSTGLTCAITGGKLVMSSSPSLVAPLTLENGEIINNTLDDTVEILSDDNDTTLQITGFEAKTANLNLYADQGDDAADKFSLNVSTADVFAVKNNGSALISVTSGGNVSMVGSLTGDGGDAMSGFLHARVAATATTITAVQCGSTFYNSGAVQMELPEASAVLGCRLTFITANASNFDLNPDNADQILVQTNAAGDAIRNATLGNSITIQALSASEWAPISVVGTWSDIN